MIGLEGTQGDADQGPDRMWIVLDGVRHVGSVGGALLPAFGSQKSPSGGRLRLLLHWGRPGPQQLVDLLNGQPEGETVLALYFGVLSADDRAQLGEAARKRRAPVAGVLDDAAIAYLACLPQDWSVAVALMAPFTSTDPYTPTGGVPEEMFYGRSEQLRKVTDRRGPSFVFGGRQLGKSALLRKAERDLAADPNRTVILETIQTVGLVRSMSLWPILGDRLAKDGVVRSRADGRDQVIDAVRGWADADGNRQLLILLDEADGFLNRDAERGRFEDVTALPPSWRTPAAASRSCGRACTRPRASTACRTSPSPSSASQSRSARSTRRTRSTCSSGRSPRSAWCSPRRSPPG